MTRPDGQFNFWDLHWNNFLVELLVAVECALHIYLVGLSGLGCR
jgi:hypothetical protein